MTIEKVLIVDDEPLLRDFLSELLLSRGFSPFTADNVKIGCHKIKTEKYDLIISDMNMPDGTGIDIIKAAREHSPLTPVLVITAYGTIENAVKAMYHGAFNYLTKPFSSEALFAFIAKAEELQNLVNENLLLKSQISSESHPLIAESPAMKDLLSKARKAADSAANIFIHGESGCGKEVLSFFIHRNSPRASQPYIKVNCAAIPETLLESEFFGHEKGAFTGATAKKAGRFELAHTGTLLLDEITEVPIHLQAKLLRAIQEKEFEHLGGTKTLSVDVRILATSNRDLKEAVSQKIFRQDLFYRLNVIPLYLPPLRERKEDILPLSQYFLEKFCRLNNRPIKTLSASAKAALLDYSWPGNIRELSNVLERVVILESPTHLTDTMLALC
ncbi:nitrogen regulation two-component transcription regulatory protein [Chlamydia felis Fe/C-56]|uniref:Nitrogen regulation two-component transcription regulatory protein n=1 Tax=Chlamydia felis (strain Fe/C-56) TaxID=264202 RepID=Q253B4_CHLFF|nr:sigma-54 dependent transcriptional regulator [Chlamydia felis]BAE81624.1 nitrogen regulation two-component transcription regulatory protein [Chlamydia felis Fe/C-56]